mgnify:CR=1 FL=1
MMNHSNILIVGAGQAAGQLLITLKQNKFSGKITLIGDEEWYPYQRPPLSKLFLSGELEHSRLFIKQANFYNDLDGNINFKNITAPSDFYLETYDAPKYIGKISGAEPMDNQSWEIGFYEGLQYAIDVAKEFGLVE